MQGRSKLLAVQWLGLSVQVRVKVRARMGNEFYYSFSALKSDKHLCLALPA